MSTSDRPVTFRPFRSWCVPGSLITAALLAVCSSVAMPVAADAVSDCYLDAFDREADSVTLGELRQRCAAAETHLTSIAVAPAADPQKKTLPAEPTTSFTQQIAAERQSLDRSYSLTPHLPNYLLPYSRRNDPNQPDLQSTQGNLDRQEAVLQISVKFPLWRRMLHTENDILFSYTSKSWFQAYNSALSKPFRETNYEPEIFWRHYGGPNLPLGVRIAGWDLGYDHQSNGRSEPLSRSWDRVLGRLALDVAPNLSMIVRAWYRIPEDRQSDDNRDIDDYLGYGDLRAIWTPNKNTFTAMFRPGTEEHGLELTWSYPITKHLRLYTQYYDGYGESLIDYDQKVRRIGIGFTINDYLQIQ